jgi:hypothetical protein
MIESLESEGRRSSEELAETLASADPADVPPIAEELAERLEAELDASAEDGTGHASQGRTP